MYITLYRKYRPATFKQVVGEEEIVRALKNGIKNNQLSHAYLFTGPRGVGKTTLARLIAKSVNCLSLQETGEACGICENCKSFQEGNFLDLVEIDAASNRGIDEIRLLKEKINYQPSQGKKKIYIIDEVHMLTKEAFNALLKTLEEPPEHVIFILATTEPDKILPTIISRCQRYDFKILSLQEMSNQIQYILSHENVTMEEEVYELIYEASGGSMRDGISVLERLMVSSEEGHISLKIAEEVLGITSFAVMEKFLKHILQKEKKELLEMLDDMWLHSIDIVSFFKDFAKFLKTQMKKHLLNAEEGLFIISKIYEVLTMFRFEEDKRLVGYVLLEKLLKPENIVEVSKKEEKHVFSEDFVEKEEVKIEDIDKVWKEIIEKGSERKISMAIYLSKARLYSFEEGILVLAFDENNIFSKEQMDEKIYANTLSDILEEIFHQKIQVKTRLLISEKKEEDHTAKKILEYFEGEMLS